MAVLDREVLAFDISGVLQAPPEGRHAKRIAGRGRCSEKSHDGHRLLRPRRHRPCRRTTEQRDELAAFHSSTSSARASTVAGTSRPSALAAVRLMTSSNLVGCSTGMSPGFAPRRILSTYSAARRNKFGKFGP